MRKIKVLQSLWGMESLKNQSYNPSLEENLARIQNAGFDGFSTHFFDSKNVAKLMSTERAKSMLIEGQAFPSAINDLIPALELANKYQIHHLTVQADVRPIEFSECVKIVEGWLRLSEQSSVPVYIETHRGRLNNDMLIALKLLDATPQLKLLADISHYYVAREFPEPPTPNEMDEQVKTLLSKSWAAHARIASPGQVQIPIHFPQHAPYLLQFSQWWQWLMVNWAERSDENATLAFTCELGPAPYAITGEDGQDLTDRWQEALFLKTHLNKLWAEIAI
ncbi:sugar phosphate isomerase/epimerase [Pantoea agglomerans]|uniref:sugar phosphate isomerase/epimerase n=1 Tax=Enterobacter agglomerans TaxID=549 RepID=UPI001303E98B|nr:sugar phosphate isomerase/epimerase [Pantoea agglomerans]